MGLLGDVDYDQIREFNPKFAAIYFMTYIIAAFFIVLNFLIAIILDGFQQSSKQMDFKEFQDESFFAKEWLHYLTVRFTVRFRKLFIKDSVYMTRHNRMKQLASTFIPRLEQLNVMI